MGAAKVAQYYAPITHFSTTTPPYADTRVTPRKLHHHCIDILGDGTLFLSNQVFVCCFWILVSGPPFPALAYITS
jgi:hypothetical protein